MKNTDKDLKELSIIDEIILENDIFNNVKKSILKNLKQLNKLSVDILLENRYNKFRKIGKGVEKDDITE